MQALCILICHFLQLCTAKTAKQLFPHPSVFLLIYEDNKLYCSANIFQIFGQYYLDSGGSNTNNYQVIYANHKGTNVLNES